MALRSIISYLAALSGDGYRQPFLPLRLSHERARCSLGSDLRQHTEWIRSCKATRRRRRHRCARQVRKKSAARAGARLWRRFESRRRARSAAHQAVAGHRFSAATWGGQSRKNRGFAVQVATCRITCTGNPNQKRPKMPLSWRASLTAATDQVTRKPPE